MPEYQALGISKMIELQAAIDSWNQSLPPLKEFILPGGCRSGAHGVPPC